MSKTVDAAAEDNFRAALVAQAPKPLEIRKQGLRVEVQSGHQVVTISPPGVKPSLLQLSVNGRHGGAGVRDLTFSWANAEDEDGVSDQ